MGRKQACNGIPPADFFADFDGGRGALAAADFKTVLRRDLKISFADFGDGDATSLCVLLDPDKTGFIAVPDISAFVATGALPAPLLDAPFGDDVSVLTSGTAAPPGGVSRTSYKAKKPSGKPTAGGARNSPARTVKAPDLSSWPLKGRASRKVLGDDGAHELYLLTLRCHPTAKRAAVIAVSASTDETTTLELSRRLFDDLKISVAGDNLPPEAVGDVFASLIRKA